MSDRFVSPLLVSTPGRLARIDFGRPPPEPAIDALGARLAADLSGMMAGLPASLRDEAEATLSGYCRGRAHFIALFYRPVWSFLHWLPPPDSLLLEQACRVQAAALFLHLWDDHLSDGQLAPDLVRLHLRSLVWQAFCSGTATLLQAAGVQPSRVQRLVDDYLATTHRPGSASTLADHAERMVRQVGIWRVVPLLFGQITGGPDAASALCRVVERFSVAWRLLDDVQDAASDIRTGQQNALYLACDGEGRAAWAECGRRSQGLSQPEAESWAVVCRGLESGPLEKVLSQINAELAAAETAALAQGWTGLAVELEGCRVAPALGG